MSGSITSASSGRCIDINNAGATNGIQAQMWDRNGGSNQHWNPH